MTLIVAFLASVAAIALVPADAWAWGPITHIVHGSTVLESLHLLPPALASLLAANSERYLYGCVGADIIQAKAYTRSVATHCHRWPVAWNIVGSARTDGELAFARGYMTHLAADILSHNHFVPLHLVLSFEGRPSGHAYWEARVDGLQGQLYADRLRRVLTQRYDDCDGLVDRVVEHTLSSFRTNKRIFDSLMGLTKLDRWQRLVRTVNDRSRFRLTRHAPAPQDKRRRAAGGVPPVLLCAPGEQRSLLLRQPGRFPRTRDPARARCPRTRAASRRPARRGSSW